jgi:hypothetical protein
MKEYNENASQGKGIVETIKELDKVSKLDDKLSDKSKNREMEKFIEKYPSFFDEESGNNREEGISQLKGYLEEEKKSYLYACMNLKKDIDEIKKELDSKKEVEQTTKTIFPIVSIHNPIIFRVLLPIFSFFIFFDLLGFNLQNLFSIPDIIIPTIMSSTVYFLWKSYRIYSKIKNYYTISKRIYIYCKKKIYFFYKKIYFFYKK